MKSVMFGGFFVARFLIKERQVGVDELIVIRPRDSLPSSDLDAVW